MAETSLSTPSGISVINHEPDDEEYIHSLISREAAISDFDSSTNGVTCSARSDCVTWILTMKPRFGFGDRTAYRALSYFDRFFARRPIDEAKNWAIKLLSIACLSLAVKMEECKQPALSEYTMEDYQFSSDVILRMELLVLNTLEWRMRSVTPFEYLGHFTSKLCSGEEPTDLCSRAIDFIFAITKVINLVDNRPSTIAAAAILAAYGDNLTKSSVEDKIKIISSPESLEVEHVFSCYTLMSENKELNKSRNLVSSDISPNIGSVGTSTVDVLDTISLPDTRNKRRRLQFPENE